MERLVELDLDALRQRRFVLRHAHSQDAILELRGDLGRIGIIGQ